MNNYFKIDDKFINLDSVLYLEATVDQTIYIEVSELTHFELSYENRVDILSMFNEISYKHSNFVRIGDYCFNLDKISMVSPFIYKDSCYLSITWLEDSFVTGTFKLDDEDFNSENLFNIVEDLIMRK